MRLKRFFRLILFIALMGCEVKTDFIAKQNSAIVFQEFSPERVTLFESYLKQHGFIGNVLIQRRDSLYVGNFGNERYDLTRRFQLASVSKPITAVAIMQLIQDGWLSLDEEVDDILPDFPYCDVTIRQLLSHSSGLSNYMYHTDDVWQDLEYAMCNEDVYDLLQHEKPANYYRPGTRFDYCNTNYALLARILEERTGFSFAEYLAAYVFLPSGMNDALVLNHMAQDSLNNVAYGKTKRGRKVHDYYLNGVTGDKGVYASVLDLFQFDQALKSGKLISDSLYTLMRKDQLKRESPRTYGFGFRIQEYKEGPIQQIIYHNGWWRGFRSYFWHQLDGHDACIIGLSNDLRSPSLSQKELLELIF